MPDVALDAVVRCLVRLAVIHAAVDDHGIRGDQGELPEILGGYVSISVIGVSDVQNIRIITRNRPVRSRIRNVGEGEKKAGLEIVPNCSGVGVVPPVVASSLPPTN